MIEESMHAWKSAALAEAYLNGVRGAVPLAREQIDVMLRLIEAGEGPVDGVLDLGCGDGILAAAILERYPGARGVLLDFSRPMLDAARHNHQRHDDKLAFVLGDYGEPAWIELVAEAAPFDVIVSGYSIHHQPDARKRMLYAELFGLLRPGGMFVNVEHVASASPWGQALFDEYFVDALYAMHVRRSSGKTRDQVAEEFYNRPDKAANLLAPVEVQCRWLREIGFVDVDCFFKVFELAVFGGRRPR